MSEATSIPLLPVPEGYRVQVVHLHDKEAVRNWVADAIDDGARSPNRPRPRYITIAWLYKQDGEQKNVAAVARAVCSHLDSPSRKKGRAIAHNRCIQAFQAQQ